MVMGVGYNPRIVTDGLVLCLDAANKRSYPGTGTTWTDKVGGNNGTLTNGPTFSSDNGGSLVFDGSNDYVNITTLSKSADCTFSFWASLVDVTAQRMLFNAGNSGSGPDLFFAYGQILWNIWDSGNNPFADMPSSATDGKLHNYVVVNDSSSSAKLYYDGLLLGTATYRSATATTKLSIGGNYGGYPWRGKISGCMVHNRALTSEEVRQNFEATKGRYA